MAVDPALFLYLNPEVEAAHPDLTSDQARSLYDSQYSQDPTILTTLALPEGFNETTFLVTSRANAGDISGVNRVLQGLSLAGAPDYLPLIYKPAVYRGAGQFDLFESASCSCDGPYFPSSNDVRPGDNLLLLQDDVFRKVATVGQVSSNTIVVSQSNGWAAGSRYVAVGIGLYDVDRLARVLYARSNAANAGQGQGSNATAMPDGRVASSLLNEGFDPDLYRALYPDGRHLADEEAYQQFAAFQELGRARIGSVGDIANTRFSAITAPFSIDGVEVCGLSTDSISTSAQVCGTKLISERAIKTYVDQKSNFDVSPTFNGYITSYGLQVVVDPSGGSNSFPAASNAGGGSTSSSTSPAGLEVVDGRVTSDYAGLPTFPQSVTTRLQSFTRGGISVSVTMDASGSTFVTDQLTFAVNDQLTLVSSADGTTRYDGTIAAVSASSNAYTLDAALQPGQAYTITDATYHDVLAVYLKKLLFEVWRRVGP